MGGVAGGFVLAAVLILVADFARGWSEERHREQVVVSLKGAARDIFLIGLYSLLWLEGVLVEGGVGVTNSGEFDPLTGREALGIVLAIVTGFAILDLLTRLGSLVLLPLARAVAWLWGRERRWL